MKEREKVAEMPTSQTIEIFCPGDASGARRLAKSMAQILGFDEKAREEVVIAVSELASNLVKYAPGGILRFEPLDAGGRKGIQIESHDRGPGIVDMEQAMGNGFTTGASLGYGLGAVNRLMDEFDIMTPPGGGTYILSRRWVRQVGLGVTPCPLAFGAATRPHPLMTDNGDTFIVKRWSGSALLGVIDGLGHGKLAAQAAQTARHYVDSHYTQPLENIFRGVGRACVATRGVVMALARFDWEKDCQGMTLTSANVGNIETRVFGNPGPMNFIVRRGIIGLNTTNPKVTKHPWDPSYVLVLCSDGLITRWRWEDFPELTGASPSVAARRLLLKLARENDDATVVVAKKSDN